MEVVVTFLGGDVDRPLITGCVYNATNAPPFPLPASKTKSGIVTRSTPRGVSGNQISFEDAKGKEQLVFHAERDLLESVGNDRDESVGRDRRATVARNADERVRGDKTVEVGGQLGESVHGNRASRCDGDVSQTTRGRCTQHTGGSFSTTVDKDYTLHVAGSGDAVIGTQGKGTHYSSMVYGDHLLGATETVTIRADKKIVLQCGASTLELGPDGVRLRGLHLDLAGSESASMSGKGPALRLEEEAQLRAKTLRLFSSEASLVLDKDAKLKGTQVKLNCDEEKPTDRKGEEAPIEKEPFKLKLSDAEYGVYANKKYHLLVDGATYEGTTDGEGVLEKQLPKDAKALTIVLWNGEYPAGEEKRWTIRMGPMAAADTARGAQERLGNLGYFTGEPKDEMDDVTRAAIRDFQAHAGVPATGELDAPTVEKLNTVHGK
jgi:type VI secretion system secreted protein VgrG